MGRQVITEELGATAVITAGFTVFPAAALAATSQTVTSAFTNGSYRGALFFVNVGTPANNQGVTFGIQARDELSNTWTSVFIAATITAAGCYRYYIHPNAAATVTAAPTPIGREWRATLQMNTTTALTVSVGGNNVF